MIRNRIRILNPVYGPKDPIHPYQNVTDPEHFIFNLNMFHSHPLPTSLYPDSVLTHLCFRSLDLEVSPAIYRDSSNVLFCILKRFLIVIFQQDLERKTSHDCPPNYPRKYKC
jgi:hypothetical protein